MTATRKAGVPATLTVDFGCPRHCQVEFNLEGVHIRNTLGQMLRTVERAHDEAHEAEPPQRVYRFTDDVIVRTALIPAAVHRG